MYCIGQLIYVWICQQRHHILRMKRSGHTHTSRTGHGNQRNSRDLQCRIIVVGLYRFTTAEDRQRLEAVIRLGIRSGHCAPDHLSTRLSFCR